VVFDGFLRRLQLNSSFKLVNYHLDAADIYVSIPGKASQYASSGGSVSSVLKEGAPTILDEREMSDLPPSQCFVMKESPRCPGTMDEMIIPQKVLSYSLLESPAVVISFKIVSCEDSRMEG
jgi:hypothetical protein